MLSVWWQQANRVACWPPCEEVISRCSSVKPRCGTAVVVKLKLHVHKVCRPKFSSFADGKQLTPPLHIQSPTAATTADEGRASRSRKGIGCGSRSGNWGWHGSWRGRRKHRSAAGVRGSGRGGAGADRAGQLFQGVRCLGGREVPRGSGERDESQGCLSKGELCFLSDASRKGEGIVMLRDLQAFF